MSRPLRNYDPSLLYFITNRTADARNWLRPDQAATEIIGAAIGRAQRLSGVKIFGFVAMSNHVHLMVQGTAQQISDFARNAFGTIARRINRLRKRRGRFWDDRYHASPILDDAAIRERLSYVLAHGVKEGLVATATEWPGLHCAHTLVLGEIKRFQWTDYRDHRHEETLELSRLPCWASKTPEAFRLAADELAAETTRRCDAARLGRRPLGVRAVLAMRPSGRPENTKRSRRPLCHASRRDDVTQFRQRLRDFVAGYRSCSVRWRRGEEVEFPAGSFRPPLPANWTQSTSVSSRKGRSVRG